jgi:hypothetical protein
MTYYWYYHRRRRDRMVVGFTTTCTISAYDVERHFQQHFSYIVAISFIGVPETGVPGENHRLVASH